MRGAGEGGLKGPQKIRLRLEAPDGGEIKA